MNSEQIKRLVERLREVSQLEGTHVFNSPIVRGAALATEVADTLEALAARVNPSERVCPTCKGSGGYQIALDEIEFCPLCGGTGFEPTIITHAFDELRSQCEVEQDQTDAQGRVELEGYYTIGTREFEALQDKWHAAALAVSEPEEPQYVYFTAFPDKSSPSGFTVTMNRLPEVGVVPYIQSGGLVVRHAVGAYEIVRVADMQQ